jgi:starch synthase (maltosyl-transferring)
VKIFRVDNPHTKPFPFWEWMIAEVQAQHPEAIFLAEAFTRPKVMKRLAKVGFNQSYSYFTWRNEKAELDRVPDRTDADRVPATTCGRTSSSTRPTSTRSTCRPAAARLPHAACAGRDAGGQLRRLQRLRDLRGRAGAGAEEYLNSEKYEIKVRTWTRPATSRTTSG